jgi:hypothetical protein
MGTQVKGRGSHRSEHSGLVQLLHRLANNCKNPARLIELYYWSREPELAEIMREIVALPDDEKATLHAFFRLAEGGGEAVTVTVGAEGDVTLSSPGVTRILMSMMRASAREPAVESLH